MMGITVLLLISTAYIASAVPLEQPTLDRSPYPRYIQIPNGDGIMQDVDLEAEPDMELLNEISRSPSNQYFLNTKENPEIPDTLIMGDPGSVHRSNFNAKKNSIFIIHGHSGNQYHSLNPVIKDAIFNLPDDVNVIIVDYSRAQGDAMADYVTSTAAVPAVGRNLGQFLAFLSSVTGASLDSMHLVGFGLGAHVVGNAGRELGGNVARITGLDPAGPLWNLNRNRLGSGDAVYVEAIHTDGDGFGIGTAIADADFFVNGGNSQPGCLTSVCNHNRSWEYFAASVSYNHLLGRSCNTYLQIMLNTCRGAVLHMGNDDLRKTGSNPASPEILVMSDPESVHRSNFKSKVQTVVVVHGWLGNQNTFPNPGIRDAYLSKPDDVNVIIVDWSHLAIAGYVTATTSVPAVGRSLGQFLAFLSSVTGTSLDSMHLVGFSLGAHVVGNAGRELGGKVARITGLDPAGPLWNLNRNRLGSGDAVYVEAIHTDGDGIGIGTAIADADFFVNGGNSQPGCLTSVCNHIRSWEYFAATVSYDHLHGQFCNTYLQIKLNTCRGAVLHMGNDDLRKTGSGKFRVNTGRRYPF